MLKESVEVFPYMLVTFQELEILEKLGVFWDHLHQIQPFNIQLLQNMIRFEDVAFTGCDVFVSEP